MAFVRNHFSASNIRWGSKAWATINNEKWSKSPSTLKITYDPEVDALYICFKETSVTTKHLEEGIAFDYDASDHLAGIEILDAALRADNPEALQQVGFESAVFCGSGNQISDA